MRLLVTGGAGFIGCNFIRWLRTRHPEHAVVNLDALTYAGCRESLADLEGLAGYEFVHGDILDAQVVNGLLERVDGVINFAAESHVDRSIEDPDVFLRTNILGLRVLLDGLRAQLAKGRRLRLLQVSTDEVYGDLGEGGGYFTEQTPLAPSSPYSASKAAGDFLVHAWRRTFGLEAVLTRCSNNYGPYQFPEKLIPLMIWKAAHDQELPVYGQGLNVRDWLYVEDHAEALWTVFERAADGAVYNIGGNNEWRNLDIVKLLLRDMGKPESLIRFVPDRLGHDLRYAIDASKLERELGWRPRVGFEEGLARTIRWYLDNPAWTDALRRRVAAQ
jgi:dTDP-glucose 4,6-dehydratase